MVALGVPWVTGLNGTVNAIAVSGANVYVGGAFTSPGNNIALWNGSSWSALGSGVNNPARAIAISGTDTYVGGYFTTAGNKSANYIAAYHDPTLPVTLVSFSAKADGNYAKLQWQTASEIKNKGFEVWRGAESEKQKAESTTFVKIGEVLASHISNLASQIYNFTDKSPLNGNNYYKLVQIDNDGKATELGVRMVRYQLAVNSLHLYPNPTTDKITAVFGQGSYNKAEVLDIGGKKLKETSILPMATQVEMDMSGLPVGSYLLRLSGDKGVEVLRVVKQ